MSEWRGIAASAAIGLLGAGALLTGCSDDSATTTQQARPGASDRFSAAMRFEGYADSTFAARVIWSDLCVLEAQPLRQSIYVADTLGVPASDARVSYVLSILKETGCDR